MNLLQNEKNAAPDAGRNSPLRPSFRRAVDFIRSAMAGQHHPEAYPPLVQESYFRRTGTHILAFLLLSTLLLSLILNWYEGHFTALAILPICALVPAGVLIWLSLKPQNVEGPLLILNGSVFIWAVGLLFWSEPTAGRYLWLPTCPPIFIFSLGLRRGSLACGLLYLCMLLFLLTPLSVPGVRLVSPGLKLRLLLTTLASFSFAWWIEYLRQTAYEVLKRTHDRLEKEALTDLLTGLGNRRDFEHHFSWIASKARRDKSTFAMALIDIDHFKRVNDTYGHEVGDTALVWLSRLLNGPVRETDRLFRWGGEEFVILLPEIGAEEAQQAAERLRLAVAEQFFVCKNTKIQLTISIGLYWGRGQVTLDEAMREADTRLYQAKNSGRNKVV